MYTNYPSCLLKTNIFVYSNLKEILQRLEWRYFCISFLVFLNNNHRNKQISSTVKTLINSLTVTKLWITFQVNFVLSKCPMTKLFFFLIFTLTAGKE